MQAPRFRNQPISGWWQGRAIMSRLGSSQREWSWVVGAGSGVLQARWHGFPLSMDMNMDGMPTQQGPPKT